MADDVKIGLEIHVPLKTEKKLFCNCPTTYPKVSEPNSLICPVCTGMPGIKPYPPNERALESAITIARLLNCEIQYQKLFLKRKHYNYPDLPKGYQITSEPFGVSGNFMGVGIWEVHMEEDPGQYNLSKGQVDYNRSGVPLVEIVTAPDIKSPEQARDFIKELLKMLEYSGKILGTGGIIRADINVSIAGGNRVEIKNVNSVRGAEKVLKLEIARQSRLIEKGQKVEQETRGYDESKMTTILLRAKESAEDYRYIPDPDLPPFELSKSYVASIEEKLPETPQEMRGRFREQYGVSEKYARVLTKDKEVALFFENIAKKINPALAATWVSEEILAQLNYRGIPLSKTKLSEKIFLEFLALIENKTITETVGKKLLERVVDSGESPKEIVEKEKLGRVEDVGELEKAVEEAIKENPNPVSDYKSGKKEAMNFLMGQVMRKMKGRADAKKVVDLLKQKLE